MTGEEPEGGARQGAGRWRHGGGTAAGALPAVRVTDLVVRDVARALGAVAPEQGGALLGPPGADLVTGFVHDEAAEVTAVRYETSSALIEQVARLEGASPARFKGTVHSHPAGVPFPSGQDRLECARALALNPQLSSYLAPILTHPAGRTDESGRSGPLGGHEMAIGDVRISWYAATASGAAPEEITGESAGAPPGGVALRPVRPVVVPVAASLAQTGAELTAGPRLVESDGTWLLNIDARISGLGDVGLFFGTDFPALAPRLMLDDGHAVALSWAPGAAPAERLRRAVDDLRGRRTHRPPAVRPGDGPAATSAEGAKRADRSPADLPTPDAPSPDGSSFRGPSGATVPTAAGDGVPDGTARMFARSRGLVSPALRERRVLLAGAGSVGSYLADCLLRSGVGALTLIDPDVVAPENLSRSVFTTADVGRAKVAALADRLRAVNPAAELTAHQALVADLDGPALYAAVEAADLVVAATDDSAAQKRLNALAAWYRTPAVFVGVYARAAGGEVIISDGTSACWQCSTRGTRDLGAPETAGLRSGVPRPATDYGTGRLVAEPGLLADIHHVASAGAKVALALLHRPGDDAELARFLDRPRGSGATYLALGTAPDYWIFPYALRDALGQHAFQSVWLTVDGDPGCPVCGPREGRTDPTAHTPPRADAAAILALHRASAEGAIP